jgi:hypothetical protein
MRVLEKLTIATPKELIEITCGEIYKMNPFCPGGRQNEPIRPQGTHFVSPASYLRSTFPKRTQCAWVLGLHVIS